jgi:hypothetical protein
MSKIFALVTLLICILNGCQTIREKASGPEFEKAKLTGIIKAQLAAGGSSDLAGGHGRCRRRCGQAQRQGVFGGEESEAEEIARKVDGVKSVVSNLEVKPCSQKLHRSSFSRFGATFSSLRSGLFRFCHFVFSSLHQLLFDVGLKNPY